MICPVCKSEMRIERRTGDEGVIRLTYVCRKKGCPRHKSPVIREIRDGLKPVTKPEEI